MFQRRNLPLTIGVSAIAPNGKRTPSVKPGRDQARFPRSSRLLRHADFERVYERGRRHFSSSLTAFYWPRAQPEAAGVRGVRVGFTVSRALGGAVQRNRIRRRLREAVRLSRPPVTVDADVVINPRKSALTADFAVLLNEVRRAFVVIEQKLAGQEAASPSSPDKTHEEARKQRP